MKWTRVFPLLNGCFLFFALVVYQPALAQPSGFVNEVYASGFDQAIGIEFDARGRMYVIEKPGRIQVVIDGQKQATPLIDISEEVSTVIDQGLLALALDPDFINNGYLYLYYIVDYHHLKNFGTPSYDPNANDYEKATVGRVTRYTADASKDFLTVDPGSRKILLGETPQTGVPSLFYSHMGADLLFGSDGTLMLCVGDGASWSTDEGSLGETFYQQALNEGIITAEENIGSYRSQILSSLNGKLIRMDPATGDGLPSNPFFDPANPRSPQSRIWARGFRNPWRMSLRPGTGGHYPEEGDPGVIYVGDVGGGSREEIDIVTQGGQNFGWPFHEGVYPRPLYNSNYVPDSHTPPAISWRNDVPRVVAGDQVYDVGSEAFPGPYFGGNCTVGGVWYSGEDFPESYRETFFFADYGDEWIKVATIDENDHPRSIENFAEDLGSITHLATHPLDGGIFYVKNDNEVRRIRYTGETNRSPRALISAYPMYGPGPLTVDFRAVSSFDPEGDDLTYSWDFGDGTTSTEVNPSHTFTSSNGALATYPVTLTVSDFRGAVSSETLTISVNNTPPVIARTSLDTLHVMDISKGLTLPAEALVSDLEHPRDSLTFRWQLSLYHNDHDHPDPFVASQSAEIYLPPLNCEYDAAYWYGISLTVEDPGGLSSHYLHYIFPECGGDAQQIAFAPISNKQTTDDAFRVQASASSGLPVSLHVVEGPAFVIGDQVYLKGQTGRVRIRAVQYGNTSFNPAPPVERTFTVSQPNGSPVVSITDPRPALPMVGNAFTFAYATRGDWNLFPSDQISVQLDEQPPILLSRKLSGSYTFFDLPAGEHRLIVGAQDKDQIPITLPLAADTLTFSITATQDCGPTGNTLNALESDLWTIFYASDEAPQGLAAHLIDGDTATTWYSTGLNPEQLFPQEVWIDLGSSPFINGMELVSHQVAESVNSDWGYELYVSDDPTRWGNPVFTAADRGAVSHRALFKAVQGRYARLIAFSEQGLPIGLSDLKLFSCARPTVKIPESSPNNSLVGIYPNPAGDHITLEGFLQQWESPSVLKIVNSLGQTVNTLPAEIRQGKLYQQISIRHLPRGYYLIELSNDARQWVGKFMKE